MRSFWIFCPIMCFSFFVACTLLHSDIFPLWASMFQLTCGTERLLLEEIPPTERNNAQDSVCVCVCVCVCVYYSSGPLMAEEDDGQVACACVYVCSGGGTLLTSSMKTFSDDWSLERITNSIPLVWQMSPLNRCFRNPLITPAYYAIM